MRRPALYLALLPLVALSATGALADTELIESPVPAQAPAAPAEALTAPSQAPAEAPAAAPVQAPESSSQSAPAGEAAATALGIGDLVRAGDTRATAGPESSSASGSALSVGGKTLIPGTTGGTAESDGSGSGALLDTGQTPLGRLQLTPWEAEAAAGGGSSSSSAAAAIARLHLIDLLSVDVLQSDSEAQYSSAGSSGASSSDGAVVDLGDGRLVVRVLHAEANSADGASSYLVGVNDSRIGTSEQAGGSCVVTIPSLLALSCLTASGGEGSDGAGDGAAAEVVRAELAGGQLPTAVLSGTSSSGSETAVLAAGPGDAEADDAAAGGTEAAGPAEATSQARGSSTPAADTLAFTGANTGLVSAAAALLLALGVAFLRLGRREQLV